MKRKYQASSYYFFYKPAHPSYDPRLRNSDPIKAGFVFEKFSLRKRALVSKYMHGRESVQVRVISAVSTRIDANQTDQREPVPKLRTLTSFHVFEDSPLRVRERAPQPAGSEIVVRANSSPCLIPYAKASPRSCSAHQSPKCLPEPGEISHPTVRQPRPVSPAFVLPRLSTNCCRLF